MGRQLRIRIAAFIPIGRVHIDDSPAALRGKTEYTTLSLNASSKVDLQLLRGTYCVAANIVDPSVASQRKPALLRAFSAWWHEGNIFITDETKTWGETGIRNSDLLILLPEPAEEETKTLIDMTINQTTQIDKKADEAAMANAVAKGVQSAIGPHIRNRKSMEQGLVFIAMAMDVSRPELADVHSTLKAACNELGLKGVRVDDVQTNVRITDTIRDLIDTSEFVVADLSDDRPNVFFEAGYAEGIGKTPIYIARFGTNLHFDVKDYPVIFWQDQQALHEGVTVRLKSLISHRIQSSK